jgi:hypothetical protein
VSSGTCGGCHRSYCGIIRYINILSMKQFLSEAESKLPIAGGLAQLASEGMEVQFAGMCCLGMGGLGL